MQEASRFICPLLGEEGAPCSQEVRPKTFYRPRVLSFFPPVFIVRRAGDERPSADLDARPRQGDKPQVHLDLEFAATLSSTACPCVPPLFRKVTEALAANHTPFVRFCSFRNKG